MNTLLCKVKDTYISNQTLTYQIWGRQPLETIAAIVHSRPWPSKLPKGTLPACEPHSRRHVKKPVAPRAIPATASPSRTIPSDPEPKNLTGAARIRDEQIRSVTISPQDIDLVDQFNFDAGLLLGKSTEDPYEPNLSDGADARDSAANQNRVNSGDVDESSVSVTNRKLEELLDADSNDKDWGRKQRATETISLENFLIEDSPLLSKANLSNHLSLEPVALNGVEFLAAFVSTRANFDNFSVVESISVDVDFLVSAGAPKRLRALETGSVCVIFNPFTQSFVASRVLKTFTLRASCTFMVASRRHVSVAAMLNFSVFHLRNRVFIVQRSALKDFQNEARLKPIRHKAGEWTYLRAVQFLKPSKPQFFLTGLTEIRDAAKDIHHWLLYHFRLGYDHIVLYDDYSSDNILEAILPYYRLGLVTYVPWRVPNTASALYRNRQLLAMEAFALLFGSQTHFLNQFDLDCFFHSPLVPLDARGFTLRELLQGLQRKYPHAGQFLVRGLWFGACKSPASTSDFVLTDSLNGTAPYATLRWRFTPNGWSIPWNFKKSLAKTSLVGLSFAIASRVIANIHLTHWWRVQGAHVHLPAKCFVYNHYKMLPWADHQEKNKHTWTGSVANITEHRLMNAHLCKIQDTSLTSVASYLNTWASQPLEQIADIVHNYTWAEASQTMMSHINKNC
jgi:hypothetical protein